MPGRKRPPHSVSVEHSVGFQECDPLGVVWHGRYVEWFEAGRTALFRSIDLDIPVIRAMNYRMFVVEQKCRYMAPLGYGDTAVIHSWFGDLSPLIHVRYDVLDAAGGRWCARASTTLAVTDARGELLAETPADMLARLEAGKVG